ncbi:MAG: hypothetical protein JXX14_01760 [Deltaproteobacteria bacterium]|nr:hypothetical protein [Deltaproteobacteria bacterium]
MTKVDSKFAKPIAERSNDSQFASRLLARRDDVSVQEKEQVLAAIMGTVDADRLDTDRRRIGRWRWGVGLSMALLLFVAGGLWGLGQKRDEAQENEFTPKGDEAAAPFFYVRCVGHKGDGACREEDRLTIGFADAEMSAYFSGFAIREADSSVIWMFPAAENGLSVRVPEQGGTLKKAIVLDAHYPAGKYTVYGLKSDQPLNRAQIRDVVNRYENGDHDPVGGAVESTQVFTLNLTIKEP